MGISASRSLPLPVKETFFSHINKNKTATSSIEYDRSMQVVLFIDTFTQNFEPQNATAAIAVLEQAGYKVHIAQAEGNETPLCCGRTNLAHGLVAEAQTKARRVLAALAPFVEQDMPIIVAVRNTVGNAGKHQGFWITACLGNSKGQVIRIKSIRVQG